MVVFLREGSLKCVYLCISIYHANFTWRLLATNWHQACGAPGNSKGWLAHFSSSAGTHCGFGRRLTFGNELCRSDQDGCRCCGAFTRPEGNQRYWPWGCRLKCYARFALKLPSNPAVMQACTCQSTSFEKCKMQWMLGGLLQAWLESDSEDLECERRYSRIATVTGRSMALYVRVCILFGSIGVLTEPNNWFGLPIVCQFKRLNWTYLELVWIATSTQHCCFGCFMHAAAQRNADTYSVV